MSISTEQLPLTETLAPGNAAEVSTLLREAHQSGTAIYPIGGGTSLAYGRPAKQEGLGLSLADLNQVIDYPARDMTITAGAGLTMASLQTTLAAENQQLPVEVPAAESATLGGLLATGWNGPRRLGYGALRDYVIGIEAVDGRGTPFHGGGRVVKNVAGYDFCKLLTGSLGTLGVITQVTFKLRPIAPRSETVVCRVDQLASADRLLDSLASSSLQPVSVNLLAGPAWDLGESVELAVGFEGSEAEVDWQIETLTELWHASDPSALRPLDATAAEALQQQTLEFPADRQAAVVLKAAVVPSGVTALAHAAREIDSSCDLLAHAGNGMVFIRFAEEPNDLGQALQSVLRPLAVKYAGHITLLSRASGGEMTSQMVWGGLGDARRWMQSVKQQFDPAGILNPGRFVF